MSLLASLRKGRIDAVDELPAQCLAGVDSRAG